MKRQGILVGKFEFNSYGRLLWTLPERHYTTKRLKTKTSQPLHIVRVFMNVVPRSTGKTNSGTRELTLKCKL